HRRSRSRARPKKRSSEETSWKTFARIGSKKNRSSGVMKIAASTRRRRKTRCRSTFRATSAMDDGARWMAHMRGGDFAAAWAISDDLLRARGGVCDWSLPRHEQSIWDGTPLRGRRVVVHCNHGLGDTVQFIRYVPLIDAASVKVIAQPSLIPLFDGMNASF